MGVGVVGSFWRGKARSAPPMPAQHITPARGFEVDFIHERVAFRADWRDGVEETSVWVKRVREGLVRMAGDVGVEGGGLRSRIETLASRESRRSVVATDLRL